MTTPPPAATDRTRLRLPRIWVRRAIAAGALGYGAAAVAGFVYGGPDRRTDAAVAVALALTFWASRRRPEVASMITLGVVWIELSRGTFVEPPVLDASTFTYPLLTLVAGLMFGGRAALGMMAACALSLPLLVTLGRGGLDLGPSLTSVDLVALVVAEVVIVITGVLTHTALQTYVQMLDASERLAADFADLFERAPDGMLVLDDRRSIVRANALATAFFGEDDDALVGVPFEVALRRAGWRAGDEPLPPDLPSPLVLRLEPAGGEARVLEVLSRAAPGGAQLILRDVTLRTALEARLAQAQGLETLGLLAGGVAHDFNNLLMAVQGNAFLLLDHGDPEVRGRAGDITDAAERGTRLVRRLLSLSRSDLAAPQRVELGEFVAGASRLLRGLLGARCELGVVTEGRGQILIDPIQIEQVLLNLVSNARDAMADGGAVSVLVRTLAEAAARERGSTLTAATQVLLEVRDTGSGMTPEVKRRLFEPFFTTKGRARGSGLGLATVKKIVTAAGGEIVVESEPGAGTRVLLFFPEAGAEAQAGGREGAIDAAGRSVLVVDDDGGLLRLLEQVLGRAGYLVTCARSAEEALTLAAAAGRVDALVTDVELPGLRGPALAERLRRRHPDAAVLFMSGYFDRDAGADADADADSALDPAVNLLLKPFTPQLLLGRLAARLAAPGGPAEEGANSRAP